MQLNALKQIKAKNQSLTKRTPEINSTLKGVLVNTHVKNSENNITFDDIQDSLLIHDDKEDVIQEKKDIKESSFNTNKAIKPILAATALIAGGCFTLSALLKKSSKNLLSTKSFEQLPDIAVNMNIKEEPQFAIYRAIRDPNFVI